MIRFVPNKVQMPRSFARLPYAKGLVAERDVKPMRGGRIAAKVLIFDSRRSMRDFWKKTSGHDISLQCCGVVNALGHETVRFDKDGNETRRTLHGDRRYFCMIGLCLGDLCSEFIAHESVHAGYCYEKRVRRNMFGKAVGDFDEERIAYPTGRILAGINSFLHDEKLYDRKPARRRTKRRRR